MKAWFVQQKSKGNRKFLVDKLLILYGFTCGQAGDGSNFPFGSQGLQKEAFSRFAHLFERPENASFCEAGGARIQ